MPITQQRQQEIADGLSDIPQPKALNKRTLKGKNPMQEFIHKLGKASQRLLSTTLFVAVGIGAGITYSTLNAKDPEWTKYLPSGNIAYYKAIMRICEDKTICPNGPADASKVKLQYDNNPKGSDALTGQPSPGVNEAQVSKMYEVPSPDSPLTSHVNNTGKQFLGMLSSTIQKTQR